MATNSKIFNSGKYSREFVDGRAVVTTNIEFPKRGLVIMNDTNKIISVDARCRNTDKRSIAKCMVKAILAEEVALREENNTRAVQKSGNAQSSYVRAVLTCSKVMVTDDKRNPIANATLSVRGCTMNGVFRDIFKFDKKLDGGLWQLVVEQGRKWDDPQVIEAMKWFVEAAIQHTTYLDRFDKAQAAAAKSTECEQEAEAKAAQEKAAKKAAQEKAAKKAAAAEASAKVA